MAMQQQEQSLAFGGMFFVQFADKLGTEFDQRIVFLGRFFRIGQVGHQREVHVGIVIAEIANLKVLDQPPDLLFVQQQTGNGDQGDAVVGDSLREVELGQDLRRQDRSDQIGHDLHCALRAGQQQHHHRQEVKFEGAIRIADGQQNCRHHQQGEQGNPGNVEVVRMAPQKQGRRAGRILDEIPPV